MNRHTNTRINAPLRAAALACLFVPLVGDAQAPSPQRVTGPQARYWLTAETQTGFAMGGGMGAGGGGMDVGSLMSAALGGSNPNAPRRSLKLDLGSTRDASPVAEAQHAVPAGLGAGASLTLLGPERAAPPEPVERDVPEMPPERQQPKGRMLFFWGCGDSVGPGQPVVLDFARMANGQLPTDMRNAITTRAQRVGPAPGRDRGFAEWPNRRHSQRLGADASLVGNHEVKGNFHPEMRFAVGAGHDFMAPLTLERRPAASGGQQLLWNSVPTATGWFATGMGFKGDGGESGDIVLWNSSSARLLGGEQLMGFLPPAEVERLIRANAVLAPQTTTCTVPREVLAAAGGPLMMVNLNGYGPELNLVHPPRPEDPKVTWDQVWAVKLRLRSVTGSVAGMEGMAGAGPGGTSGERAAEQKQAPTVKDQVKDALKGLFSR